MRRVVITGLGVISPLGNTVDIFWKNIQENKVGIVPIGDRVDVDGLKVKVAAFVNDFEPLDWVSKMEVRRYDRFSHFAIAAAMQAMQDAGFDIENPMYDSDTFGTFIGNGIGGLQTWSTTFYNKYVKGDIKPKPLFIPMVLPNMATGNVAIKLKAQGPSNCPVTACAAGTTALGEAFRAIKHGDAEMMIAGGTESSITNEGLGAFESLTALSTESDPLRASIPFDTERNGFVMGEGSALLVLEELEHAKKRGAKIYGEIVGFGATTDAYHMTSPNPTGHSAAKAMQLALREAGITPSDINYINAHGTSTKANDTAETIAVKNAFGDAAYKIPISSTKSMTGHLLGAAGAVEGLITALAVYHDFVPATATLKDVDPELDLDYVPQKGRKQVIQYAMSNNFGFGGHNASIIMKKYEDV